MKKVVKSTIVLLLIGMLAFAPIGCRKNININNPAVVQAAALLDASNTCKTLEEGLLSANNAVEALQAGEPDYYAKVKPLLRKISAANVVAAQKIQLVSQGGTADWRSALIAVGSSTTPADLTSFGFKNPNSQLIVQGGFALLVATLSSIQTKFGGK